MVRARQSGPVARELDWESGDLSFLSHCAADLQLDFGQVIASVSPSALSLSTGSALSLTLGWCST